jgi:hypothetical protein
MGGLSNIIDGLYSNTEENAAEETDQRENSGEMSPENTAADGLRIPAQDQDERAEPWVPSAPDKSLSLQALADEMSSEDASDPDTDDVFSTPVREEDDLEALAPAPTPPSEVERTQFSEMVASAASDSGDEFTIAMPPSALSTQDSESVDSGEDDTRPESVTDSVNEDSEDSEDSEDTEPEAQADDEVEAEQEDLLENEGQHSFIWTRASDDIVPSKRRR